MKLKYIKNEYKGLKPQYFHYITELHQHVYNNNYEDMKLCLDNINLQDRKSAIEQRSYYEGGCQVDGETYSYKKEGVTPLELALWLLENTKKKDYSKDFQYKLNLMKMINVLVEAGAHINEKNVINKHAYSPEFTVSPLCFFNRTIDTKKENCKEYFFPDNHL